MYLIHKLDSFIKKNILKKTKGSLFAVLVNTYNLILNKNLRISYVHNQNIYKANNTKNNRFRYFPSENYGIYAYLNSLEARGDQIGNDYLLDFIDFKEDDTVIDCGAHVGDFLLWFENKNLGINYIAFEPLPNEFICLEKNIKNHKIYNGGLWHEEKK